MSDKTHPADFELLQFPQMCLFFDGIDDETDDVRCRMGHISKGNDYRCFENQCPDYTPDGVDVNGLCADILTILRDHGRPMTDDQLTANVILKQYGRRNPN